MQPILVALDSSPRAAGVLQAARELAAQSGARLLLVRAVSLPHEMRAVPPLSPAEISLYLARQAEEDLRGFEETLPPELRGGCRVVEGVPWEVICSAAREIDARLIVIGAHGFGFWDRVLGSTSTRVVNHADRSVLIVREPPVREVASR